MTTDYIDIQRAVNGIYKDALIEILAAQNGPIDRITLNTLMLGGIEPTELPRWSVEPYTPALGILLDQEVVIQYHRFDVPEDDPAHGDVVFDLRERATAEQIAASDKVMEDGPGWNWNDPTNWRHGIDEAVEMMTNLRRNMVGEFLIHSAMAKETEQDHEVH